MATVKENDTSEYLGQVAHLHPTGENINLCIYFGRPVLPNIPKLNVHSV